MNIYETVKDCTTKARQDLHHAFDVARADIQGGKIAAADTMHNILDATFAAIARLSDALDALAESVSESKSERR
jgi:hypothetical protein